LHILFLDTRNSILETRRILELTIMHAAQMTTLRLLHNNALGKTLRVSAAFTHLGLHAVQEEIHYTWQTYVQRSSAVETSGWCQDTHKQSNLWCQLPHSFPQPTVWVGRLSELRSSRYVCLPPLTQLNYSQQPSIATHW